MYTEIFNHRKLRVVKYRGPAIPNGEVTDDRMLWHFITYNGDSVVNLTREEVTQLGIVLLQSLVLEVD